MSMDQTRERTDAGKSESHLDQLPVTPSGKSHREIDQIVRKLAAEHDLPLPERHKRWSPSKSRASAPETCYSCVKYLYFAGKPALYRAIAEFKESIHIADDQEQRLKKLLKCFENEKWILQNAIRPPSSFNKKVTETHQKQSNFISAEPLSDSRDARSKNQGLMIPMVEIPLNRSAKGVSSVEYLPEAVAQQDAAIPFINSHARYISSEQRNEAQMATDADDDYATPPQSPSPDMHFVEPLSHQKRRTEDSFRDGVSSKQRKTLNFQGRTSLRRVDSAINSRTEKSIWNIFRDPIKSADTSFASTTDMSCTSSMKQQSKSSTACTSFNNEVNDIDQTKVPGHVFTSSDTFSIDDETICQHVKSYEPADTHVYDPPTFSKLDLNNTETQGTSKHAHKIRTSSPRKRFPKQVGLEHHQVRDLPKAGLFVQDGPRKPHIAFNIWYECARVALANDLCSTELTSTSASKCSSPSTLWDNLKQSAQYLKMPEPCSATAWVAAQEGFKNISLRAKVSFNTVKNGPLFKLCLEPLQFEISCRFQRKFGGDRFLYLEFPVFDDGSIPQHLKDQSENLRVRFLQWLKVEKSFLGRRWSAFHYSTNSKKSTLKRTQSRLQRVVLFATEGYDIPPITMDKLINWFICLENKSANIKLPYCKAYSRLDLGTGVADAFPKEKSLTSKGLSKTVPTVVFRPSQLRIINNTLADGSPESTEFDDLKLNWPKLHDADHPQVMNDGCSRISAGAALEVWAKMNESGPVPSFFQARIGGCKGLWICSTSASTNDLKHQELWIEIAPSQKKFEPHAEDECDSTFDPERLTFEVLDHSRPPSCDKLHVDFLPILNSRGVSSENLAKIVQVALDHEKCQLFEALENPVNLRRWTHEHFQRKRGDYKWIAAMPSFLGDKINYLLEAGFDPKRFKILADLTHQFVKNKYGAEMKHRFQIPMARTASVMGIADPLGVLEPGQVHLAFSRGFYDAVSGESYPCLDRREVLVARHPTLRCSDIQKVRAVYKSELGHLSDVVVFPSKGSYPLAAKLQGGDYDGDTFWMCWDPQLTSTFRNAPPPTDVHTPEALGITIDARQVCDMNGENIVEEFLFAGLEFKLNPDLLGKATVLHRKVAYHENSIDTPAVKLLADLHDYLIDSAKNGFVFCSEDYQAFMAQLPNVSVRALKEPVYKQAMAFSTKEDLSIKTSERDITKYKREHISDWIYFEIMSPHINTVLESLLDVKEKAETDDSDLKKYFDEAMNDAEDILVRAELEELPKALDCMYKSSWVPHVNRNYEVCLEKCFEEYDSLKPSNLNHAVIRCWMQKPLEGIPSQWELIKASCLFKTLHHRFQFCFGIAGKQLAFLKAGASQRVHFMASLMWANMKPRKALKTSAEESADLTRDRVDLGLNTPTEDSDSEIGDFMTAPDVDMYSDVDEC